MISINRTAIILVTLVGLIPGVVLAIALLWMQRENVGHGALRLFVMQQMGASPIWITLQRLRAYAPWIVILSAMAFGGGLFALVAGLANSRVHCEVARIAELVDTAQKQAHFETLIIFDSQGDFGVTIRELEPPALLVGVRVAHGDGVKEGVRQMLASHPGLCDIAVASLEGSDGVVSVSAQADAQTEGLGDLVRALFCEIRGLALHDTVEISAS